MYSDRDKLEKLFSFTAELVQAKDIYELAELVSGASREILGIGFGTLMYVKGDVLAFHNTGKFKKYIEFPLSGNNIVVQAAKTGDIQHVRDLSDKSNYIRVVPEDVWDPLSEVAIPVKVHEEVVGVFNSESEEEDAFSDRDVELLKMFVCHIEAQLYRIRVLQLEEERDEAYRNGVVFATQDVRNKIIMINQSVDFYKLGHLSEDEFIDKIRSLSKAVYDIVTGIIEE